VDSSDFKDSLLKDRLRPKKAPALLSCCEDTPPNYRVDYIGTSFGLTLELYNFWSRLEFLPVYLRQSESDITGEHSCIMLRPLKKRIHDEEEDESYFITTSRWVENFTADFRSRFVHLLSSSFKNLGITLSLSLLDPPVTRHDENTTQNGSNDESYLKAETIKEYFSDHDLLRLTKYSRQMAEITLIMDLLPPLCWLLFKNRFRGLTLSYLQCAILLAMGCQKKDVKDIASEFNVPANQIMALFNKSIHKMESHIKRIEEKRVESDMHPSSLIAPTGPIVANGELPTSSFQEELKEGANKWSKTPPKRQKDINQIGTGRVSIKRKLF